MKHLWDKGQMWSLFATTAAYAMNTFASEALSGLSPFQLVFLRDPPTSLSFPKIDTIPVKHREYYNLLLAKCKQLFAGFPVLSCPKCALVWGNCRERLCVEIFVRVLHSSEVISLILCK